MHIALHKQYIKIGLVDLGILTAIYFLPAVSHIILFPLYLLDPMRILLFTALLTTKKENTYIIALILPLISTFFSGHPIFPKNILISIELLFNIYIFYSLTTKINKKWVAASLSILGSKLLYYALKILFIELSILSGSIIATPLIFQLLPILLIPIVVFIVEDKVEL